MSSVLIFGNNWKQAVWALAFAPIFMRSARSRAATGLGGRRHARSGTPCRRPFKPCTRLELEEPIKDMLFWRPQVTRLRQGQQEVVEAVLMHSEPSTMTTAVAAAGDFRHGTLTLDPLSLEPVCRPRSTGE